mmetsp:Transcript_36716/g.90665  ORF Transcript_36716/g.90665 Transcript_36716/m.90665 type:complete len:164 (-) Transcript_36716:49-540(-)
MYTVGRGVTRSKRQSLIWTRKAADAGLPRACMNLAIGMYQDQPHAREAGDAGFEMSAWDSTAGDIMLMGHDVPPDVLADVVHWIHASGHDPVAYLQQFLRQAVLGAKLCSNDGCEVVGHPKDFKLCAKCKTARYCGAACQKLDWTTGHREKCGVFKAKGYQGN